MRGHGCQAESRRPGGGRQAGAACKVPRSLAATAAGRRANGWISPAWMHCPLPHVRGPMEAAPGGGRGTRVDVSAHMTPPARTCQDGFGQAPSAPWRPCTMPRADASPGRRRRGRRRTPPGFVTGRTGSRRCRPVSSASRASGPSLSRLRRIPAAGSRIGQRPPASPRTRGGGARRRRRPARSPAARTGPAGNPRPQCSGRSSSSSSGSMPVTAMAMIVNASAMSFSPPSSRTSAMRPRLPSMRSSASAIRSSPVPVHPGCLPCGLSPPAPSGAGPADRPSIGRSPQALSGRDGFQSCRMTADRPVSGASAPCTFRHGGGSPGCPGCRSGRSPRAGDPCRRRG